MSTVDERDINPTREMARLAESFLPLALWNFKKSFESNASGDLIYDSEWCRLNLVWGGWDYGEGNTISIYYGRLHAPNNQATMMWNGEECHCWHRVEHALHFLDHRTPDEAAKQNYSHPITKPFYSDEFRQKFYRRQPEWLVHMHAAIWRQYGTRLFELFDLRQPNLWEQYCKFLRAFYDIKGRSRAIKPSPDKVC
jgi:hypothetical protein